VRFELTINGFAAHRLWPTWRRARLMSDNLQIVVFWLSGLLTGSDLRNKDFVGWRKPVVKRQRRAEEPLAKTH
jgi:hypothetical protein